MTDVPHIEDIVRLQMLAKEARRRADASGDPDLARRLREIAVKHERDARRLQNENGAAD
jgi:hypothetical protein